MSAKLLEQFLFWVHGLSAAAWFGAIFYRTAVIDSKAFGYFPNRADYDRAAPFRALCARWGQDPAYAAHRYALSMPNIDTLVLGVKNRAELAMCVQAEADGPYAPAEMAEIDGLGLARAEG